MWSFTQQKPAESNAAVLIDAMLGLQYANESRELRRLAASLMRPPWYVRLQMAAGRYVLDPYFTTQTVQRLHADLLKKAEAASREELIQAARAAQITCNELKAKQ